jgi:hypothetical protein
MLPRDPAHLPRRHAELRYDVVDAEPFEKG